MKDPLYGNKVAAAVLIVALLAIGLPTVVGTFAELSEHVAHHDEEAYIPDCPEGIVYAPFDCSGLGGVAETDDGPVIPWVNYLAQADIERGARAAAICSSCHSFDKGGPNGTGPNLWEVVGRPVASVAGYAYSSALQGLGGVWDYETLDPYLENSQAYVSGTQMAQKIRKDQKRADIIAYLGSLSDNPVPLPEPVEVPEPGAEGEETDPMQEAGEVAADNLDFEAAQPGEAVRPDSSVNNPGDDGYPGDPSKGGSNITSSSDEAGGDDASNALSSARAAEDGQDSISGPDGDAEQGAGGPGQQQVAPDTVDSGLPNPAAAQLSEQESAPDEPGGVPDGEASGQTNPNADLNR